MIEAELADGTVLEFPDGTDKAVIQRVVKQRLGKAVPTPAGAPLAAPAPFERAGGLGSISAGVADAAIRAKIGLSQFGEAVMPQYRALRQATGASAEEQAVLREQEAEYEADPEKLQRLGGNVGANVLATALPGAAVARGATKAASAIPRALSWLRGPTAFAATSGVQGLALNPGKGETLPEQFSSKAGSAGEDAMWGAGIGATGGVLKRALTQWFKPSAEATNLFRQGVNPTLQQGTDSRVARFIGGLTSGAVDVKHRQNREVIDALLKRIAPDVDTKEMNIPEKVAILQQRFTGPGGEFEQVLGGKNFPVTNAARSELWREARGPRGTQPAATEMATEAMSRTGTALNAMNSVSRMGMAKMQEYQRLLDDAVASFNPKGGELSAQAHKNLARARTRFDEMIRDPALSVAEREQLRDVESRFSDFLKFRAAADKPAFHTDPSVAAVTREYKGPGFATAENATQRELLEPANRVMGLTPTQEEARTAVMAARRTMLPLAKMAGATAAGGAAVAGNPIGMALAPFYGLSFAGQTAKGAKFMFGETAAQRALAEQIRKAAPYLGYGAGQSFTGED